MRSSVVRAAAAVAVTFFAGVPTTTWAQVPESTDPIKIALFDWTSVNINAKILGGILEKLGYTVESANELLRYVGSLLSR